MIFIFIVAVIGLIISITGLNEDCSVGSNMISLLLFIVLIIAAASSSLNKPKAIDVYKGKTQMVLDYNQDGTYDSIVVWKRDNK